MIRYSYVWRHEAVRGHEEGKARPCAVVLATTRKDDKTVVVVAPITRMLPSDPGSAIEIPAATKVRLGLDHNRSWVVLNDLNFFEWPGPDIRPIKGTASFAYGYLPEGLTAKVIQGIREQRTAGKTMATRRGAARRPPAASE